MRVSASTSDRARVDAVWLEDGRIVDTAVADSGFDPASAAA